MVRAHACLAVAVAALSVSSGCKCPTVAGPTAPVVATTVTLAPGEFRVIDVPTPSGTTQINVTVTWIAGVSLWRVDTSCPAETATQCPRLTPGSPLTGPVQAQTISMSGGPIIGETARFVLQNGSGAEATVRLTLAPRRAGCT